MIDGGIIREFSIDYNMCKEALPGSTEAGTHAAAPMNAKDPASSWAYTIAYLKRSHDRVLPLYQLEKSGKLHGPDGKAFVINCLNDGGTALGDYYATAWTASAPTDKETEDFIRYDNFTTRPPRPSAPRKDEAPSAPEAPAPSTPAAPAEPAAKP